MSSTMSKSTIINSNKRVLITGANQGIGLHTAMALARKGGYDITMACRNQGRAREGMRKIREQNPEVKLDWLRVDLADLDSVRQMVERIWAEKRYFDVVILNAGVLLPKEAHTVDGNESTFQVNFLSHFLLIDGIVKHQQQCGDQQTDTKLRVVTLTSIMIKLCGNVFALEKNRTKWERMFANARRWKAYALSKFAAALLAQHLNALPGVKAYAVHPGAVKTQMATCVGSARSRKFLFFLKGLLIEPEVAASNVVFCVENELGPNEFRNAGRVQKLPPAVCKQRNLEALIRLSAQLTAPFRSWEPAKAA